MIASNLKPNIIYKEKLHKPRIANNNDKLEKNSDKLLENLDKINVSVISSFSELVSNLQDTLDRQTLDITTNNKENLEYLTNLQTNLDEKISRLNVSLQDVQAKLNTLLTLPDKLESIMQKLEEFDVTEAAEDSSEDQEDQNEQEDIPKDWISDEEGDESDGD